MPQPPTVKKRTSAGGIIFRKSSIGIEVALISVKGGKAWCLPKGIIDKDERAYAAALREVKEETGLNGEIINKIGEISYWFYSKDEGIRVHKTVYFYLMRYISGDTKDHDREVDDARWFPIKDVMNLLTYKGEKEIMVKAMEMMEKHSKPNP